MIDIHNHILPGVDDGAADMDEAIQMAAIAARDGIRHIIATPHLPGTGLDRAEIEDRTAALNACLKEAKIDVRVYPGAEIPVYMLDNDTCRIGLAGTRYLLTEFPLTGMLPFSSDIFSFLTGLGYRIIIAHPERCPTVIKNPEWLLDLLSPGVMLQITADSLNGKMGKEVLSLTRYLLKKQVVTFMASDGHNVYDRRPELSAGVKAAEKYLKQQAIRLVDDNPRKILSAAS
ncbi:MAG: CpsB/CapC family capsule biosynthesis tyrosine phosphatase [Thermodesulfobacteriota bacterium]